MARKKDKSGSLLGALFNTGAKIVREYKKQTKASKRQSKAAETQLARQAKERERAYQYELQRTKEIELADKGYVKITISSFFKKYRRYAVIPIDLMHTTNEAILRGEKHIYVLQSQLDEMDAALKARAEKERLMYRTVENNNKGIAYEQEGKINEAIKTYEKNIELGYPAHHSFKRLMILYRKEKNYASEIRVIHRALEVFPDYNEYVKRLSKVEQLINKINVNNN